MPEKRKQERKILLRVLEQRFIPLLLAKDFKRFPLRQEEKNAEMNMAFPFGYMKRAKGLYLDLLEIQLDKHGKPMFVINFGVASPEGIDLPWAHIDQDKASASDLPEAYRLYNSTGFMKWFSPSWIPWPSDIETRMVKVVEQAIAVYPEVEEWFATRTVGPHLRRFGYPIKGPENPSKLLG